MSKIKIYIYLSFSFFFSAHRSVNRSHLEPPNRGGWCRGRSKRVFRGKGIERKTNGGNINPAKTKVSLADLTFPCARSRVCSPRSVFSSLRNGSFGKKRNGNIGKIAFVGVPGVHLVSADRRARQGSEGTGSSG